LLKKLLLRESQVESMTMHLSEMTQVFLTIYATVYKHSIT